jgi:two-component system, cell cycle response regulator DivK
MSKILLFQVDEIGRDMLARRLKRKGFETVRIIDDATQAVEIADNEQPDLILMDMSLPLKNGEKAIFELKTSKTTQHIPIIGLTAHARASDKEKMLKAGCDEVDTQPIELSRLFSKMTHLLSTDSSVAN